MAIQSEAHNAAHKLKPESGGGVKRPLATQHVNAPAIHACPHQGCKRRFNRKYTLAEHMKTHTGERPHVCPVRTCAKRFSTSGNLSRHKRLHGYIEPLKCPVAGCICTFPSNNKLEKHMKFHYGGAVKVCSVPGCGKTFSTTGNLNRHMKHQHPDLPAAPTAVIPTSAPAPGPPQFLHGSPTSMEQWPVLNGVPQFKGHVSSVWPPQTPAPQLQGQLMLGPQQSMAQYAPPMAPSIYSPTKSCMELFEDVWNPELLDTLVNVLHDPSVRC